MDGNKETTGPARDTTRSGTGEKVTLHSLIEERVKNLACDPVVLARAEQTERRRIANVCTANLTRQLGELYSGCTVKGYEVYDPKQKPALSIIREIGAGIEDFIEDRRGLVLYGSVGTGKDHLLAALLLHAARQGIAVGWANCRAFYGSKDRALFAALNVPVVLGLSDPAPVAGELPPWHVEDLKAVVDERYRRRKRTWVTINCEDAADAERRLSSPVWDRLQERARLVPMFWPSFRERT